MVYDCFPFFNEIELLELRLHTLRDLVDRFVIVEADQTFTGIPKDFLLMRSPLLAEFAEQIIYVKVTDMPDSIDPWDRAFHQKNAIMRGLTDCDAEDLILVSDLDEIPSPQALQYLLSDSRCRQMLRSNPIAFSQLNFYYFVNCLEAKTWQGTVAILFGQLKSPQNLRNLRDRLPRLRQAGWHFSYLGGPDRIIAKLNSYCDTKNNTPQNNSPEYIQECIQQGSTAIQVGEAAKNITFVELDESFPAYLETLVAKYPYLHHEAPRRIAAAVAFPQQPAEGLYNKPRWYWYRLKRALVGEAVET